MFKPTATPLFKAIVLAGALALSHSALAGRVILNNDEWTLSNQGFAATLAPTTAFATNLASYMNVDGGGCNLLVYSGNSYLTGSTLKSTLNSAGCSVTYSTGAFDAGALSGFDGVFLGGLQFGYSAATLASYVNSGHSAYIAGGTGSMADEEAAWDLFTHEFGLDFGTSFNGIKGTLPIVTSDPLFNGVSELYFNNGNTVGLFGANPYAEIISARNGATGQLFGALGLYDSPDRHVNPENVVPEPATLALLGLGLAGLGFSRRRSG